MNKKPTYEDLEQKVEALEEEVVEARLVQDALRESEEKFRALADSTAAAVMLYQDDRWIFVNRAAQRITGYSAEELFEMNFWDIVHPEYRELVRERGRKRQRREEATSRYEFKIITKDGAEKWLDLAGASTMINGRPAGLATVLDITERKRADEALKKSEEKLRSLFDNAIEGIYQTTPEGRIVSANMAYARMYGYGSPEEVVNSVTDIARQMYVDPADRKRAAGLLTKYGYLENFECPQRRKDGTIFWVSINARLARLKDGTHRFEGFVVDITKRKLAEADRERLLGELSAERALWRATVENMLDPVIICDAEGRAIYVNPPYEKLMGRPIAPGLDADNNSGYYQLYQPDGKLFPAEELPSRKAARMGENVRNVEIVMRSAKGHEFTAVFSAAPLRDADGKLTGSVSVGHDITRVKLAEKALRKAHDELELRVAERTAELKSAYDTIAENERLYRNLFENASIGMFQSRLDGSGFLRINKAYAKMLGYGSPEEVMSAITDTATQIHTDPGNRREFLAALKQHDWYYTDQHYFRKDGSVMIGKLAIRKVHNPDGSPAYLEGIIEDVTESKSAEKALHESEEKYRSVVESSFVGLSIAQDRVLRFVNRGFCEITGYTYDDLVDRVNPMELVYPADRKATELAMKKLRDGAGSIEYDCRMVRKDSQLIYVKIFGTSVMYNGRRAAAGTIIDVTKEKDLEQQLRQSQKLEALGTLAGGIAHDFNNILAGIMGFTEMVKDDMDPASPEHRRLELVLKGAHRGRDLVRQILAFSRQAEHEQKPVALSDIVEEGLKLVRPLIPTTTEIRLKTLSGDDTILADPAQIHQVLMNLCTNAAQAMAKKGGVLEVTVTRDHFKGHDSVPLPDMKPGDYVTLTVSDTGPGMKPDVLERIFDPFFTTKAPREGTGLGLSVAHGIVKRHGGAIRVESEPGKGSVFYAYLPRLDLREAAAAGEEVRVKGGKECILFVDDEELNVELNNERLTGLGYEVVATTSSIEALEIFKREPQRFHLVITDYTMPRMTGLDLARELMKVREDIPIILCTGYNDNASPDKAKKAGIREFLLKPQGKRELDQAIRRVLDAKT